MYNTWTQILWNKDDVYFIQHRSDMASMRLHSIYKLRRNSNVNVPVTH